MPVEPVRPVAPASFGRTIAIVNGKGGVGKTTITANVGGLLAASGYRVLLIDLDPQGNLGLDLGYYRSDVDDVGKAFAAALAFDLSVEVQAGVRDNVDVIVGGRALHQASAALAAGHNDSRSAIRSLLAPLVAGYDVVLIDCPPGDDTLQTAALATAGWFLIPGRADEATARASVTGRDVTWIRAVEAPKPHTVDYFDAEPLLPRRATACLHALVDDGGLARWQVLSMLREQANHLAADVLHHVSLDMSGGS